jgi:hypothetical protein
VFRHASEFHPDYASRILRQQLRSNGPSSSP